VAFKALLVGLASLVLVFAGSISTVLADGSHHNSPGQPGHNGSIQFYTPFIIGITGLLINKVTDCATGAAIAPEKLTAEFVFADGAQPPFHFSQLKKIIIKAEGYQPKEITSFMTMQFNLFILVFTFIVPLEGDICLQDRFPVPPGHCLKLQLDRASYWVFGRNADGNLVAAEQAGRVTVVGNSIRVNSISTADMPGFHFLRLDFSATDGCFDHLNHGAKILLDANVADKRGERQYGRAAANLSDWLQGVTEAARDAGVYLESEGQILSNGMIIRSIAALRGQITEYQIRADCSDGHDRKEIVYTITVQ